MTKITIYKVLFVVTSYICMSFIGCGEPHFDPYKFIFAQDGGEKALIDSKAQTLSFDYITKISAMYISDITDNGEPVPLNGATTHYDGLGYTVDLFDDHMEVSVQQSTSAENRRIVIEIREVTDDTKNFYQGSVMITQQPRSKDLFVQGARLDTLVDNKSQKLFVYYIESQIRVALDSIAEYMVSDTVKPDIVEGYYPSIRYEGSWYVANIFNDHTQITLSKNASKTQRKVRFYIGGQTQAMDYRYNSDLTITQDAEQPTLEDPK